MPRHAMIHDRHRVFRLRRFGKFGDPLAYVLAMWVELSALQSRVEDSKIRSSIRTGTRNPLPARGVAGKIGIHEIIEKPRRTFLPRYEKVLDQERGNDHSYTIVHPAGLPELAHASVNDWISRQSALPRTQL